MGGVRIGLLGPVWPGVGTKAGGVLVVNNLP